MLFTSPENLTRYVTAVRCTYQRSNALLQGRFLPVFASQIYDRNAQLVASGMTAINLTSVIIGQCLQTPKVNTLTLVYGSKGNGCTEDATMLPSYYDMMCMNTTVSPVIDIRYGLTYCILGLFAHITLSTCVHVKHGVSIGVNQLMHCVLTRTTGINRCLGARSGIKENALTDLTRSIARQPWLTARS